LRLYNISMNKTELIWKHRASELDLIASVWSCNASEITPRTVLADPCISIIFVKRNNSAKVVLRGPETKPRNEHYMPGDTWLGVRLRPGVRLKNFPTEQYIDCSRALPAGSDGRFLFEGTLLEFPDFDNAEQLIEQMRDLGYINGKALDSHEFPKQGMSPKTYSRFIKRSTGLSPYKLQQLQRIAEVFRLLQQGMPPATIASELGFADQAHLHRAAKQFLGHTPKELLRWPRKP
jgi:hypothetical protein